MATRQELENRIYKKLNESSDSSTYDETTIRLLINEKQVDICEGNIVSLLDDRVFKAPFLRFLAVRQFLKTVQPITLGDDIATTDTEITLTTTFLTDSGFIYINGDILEYTGKTSTQITGVTGIGTTHNSGDTVKQAYFIPTTASKGFQLKMLINGIETIIPYLDDRDKKDKSLYFTIVFDNSTSAEYIVLEGINYDNETLIFDYFKKPTDLSASSSTSDIPDPYAVEIIPNLVVGELLYDTEEQKLGLGFLKSGYAMLNKMYISYGERVKQYRKKVKRPAFDLSSIGK